MQSRLESLVEACLNTAFGFVIALAVWRWIVAPLFNLPVDMGTNLGITGIFTVASVVRSYAVRRWFNGGFHRLAIAMVRR